MITLAATSVAVAIVLGIGWRIYSWDPRLAVVPEIELQLRRLRPPSRMQRCFGRDWLRAWGNTVHAIAFCFWLMVIAVFAFAIVFVSLASIFSFETSMVFTVLLSVLALLLWATDPRI